MAKVSNGHLPTGILLSLVLACALPCVAETPGPGTPGAPSSNGAYQKLSASNRKVVDALFEAQTTNGMTTPLTRDEIAAQKNGRGWSEVFKTMKAQGLLQEKNLGQVVSGYAQHHRVTTVTTAVNRGGRPRTSAGKGPKTNADDISRGR